MEQIIIAALIVAIGYPLMMRALARLVQPRRLRLVDLGLAIARHEALPEAWRAPIAWMIKDAYSPWPMLVAALATPLVLVEILRGNSLSLPQITDKPLRDLLDEFIGCHIASAAAANPLCAMLVSLELAVLAFVMFPLGKAGSTTRIQLATLVKAEQVSHHYVTTG